MICSECGTQNPSGSKFCNKCGSNLRSDARQICPNCETPNPEHLLYCDSCGTRLAEEHLPEETEENDADADPHTRSEPFSLPTRPPGQTANLEIRGEIPEWLKTGEEAEVTENADDEEKSDLPAWARAAQERGEEWEDEEAPTLDEVSGDHTPTDDLPIWLMDEETSDTIFKKEKSTDELFEASRSGKTEPEKTDPEEDDESPLPKWLQGLAQEKGPLPSHNPGDVEGEAEPDESGSDEADRDAPIEDEADTIVGSLRSWLDDIDAEEMEEGLQEEQARGDAGEWLDDLDDETTANAAVEPAGAEQEPGSQLDDWTSALEEPEAESSGDSPADTVPEWLAGIEITGDSDAAVQAEEEDLPGWLADTEAGADSAEEGTEAEEQADGVPDWLSSLDSLPSEISPPLEEELPPWKDSTESEGNAEDDWLAALGMEEEETGTGESASLNELEIEETTLDWLAELEAEAAEAPDLSADQAEPDETFTLDPDLEADEGFLEEDEPDDDEVPEWLLGLQAEDESAETVPPAGEADVEEEADWLSRLDDGDDLSDAFADEPQAEAEEVPDWLLGLDAEDDSEEPGLPAGEAVAEEEADWLSDLDDGDDLSDAFADEPPAEAEEVPEWLLGVDVEDDSEEPGLPTGEADVEEEADWLSGLDDGDDLDDAFADEPPAEAEEVPEWLLGLDAKDDSEAAGLPAGEAGVEEEADWLSGLDDGNYPDDAFADESEAGAEGVPEWLLGLDAEDDSVDSGAPVEDEEIEEEVDWLSGLDDAEVEGSTPVADADDDAPDWMTAPDAPTGDKEEGHAPEEAFPEWLRGLETDELHFAEEGSESEEDDLPAWVGEASPADTGKPDDTDEEYFDWLDEEEIDAADEPSQGVRAEEPDLPTELIDAEGPRAEFAMAAADEGTPGDEEDWLNELSNLEETDEPDLAEAAEPTAELPDWLQEIAPPQTGSLVPPDEGTPVTGDLDDFLGDLEEDDELPGWLMGVEGEEPGLAQGKAAAEQEDEEEGLPDWLYEAELADDDVADEWDADIAHSVPAGEEVMDLPAEDLSLAEEAPAADFEAILDDEERLPETEGSAYVPADELPAWLGDVMEGMDDAESFTFDKDSTEKAAPLPATEAEEASEELTSEELSTWLAEEAGEGVEPDAVAEPTPLDELPEWLRPPGGIEGVSLDEGDKWGHLLDELPPPQEAGEALPEAEIPEWLQALKPPELMGEAQPEARADTEEVALDSGPLAGLTGVVDIEPVMAETRAGGHLSRYTVSEEQRQQAALLRQMVHTSPQALAVDGGERQRAEAPLLRIVLALLLLGAMLTGLFSPELVDTPAGTLGETNALIAEVAPRPVLVAFDYTPAMAGALDTQATLLLEEIAKTGSPILLASQSAAGLALAEQQVATLTDAETQYVGYLPGGTVGLRGLANCVGETDSRCQTVFGGFVDEETSASLTNTGLIIVLAGDQESGIRWIEQVASATNIPLVAVVPHAIAPVMAPYQASGQLAGMVSESPATLPGSGEEAGAAFAGPAQATALALGQWLVAGLLLLGGIFYLVKGTNRSSGRDTA